MLLGMFPLGGNGLRLRQTDHKSWTDLIDYLEPTMAIVGSRGLGKLQG